MTPSSQRISCDEYTVACICPRDVELAAAQAMLDQTHDSLSPTRDGNTYTLGKIGVHNVVMAVMPETGTNRAAIVATQLLNDFPSIRFGLLIGIGGGVPNEEEDDSDGIRLGDVVVSKPTGTIGGVVQFDQGKKTVGGQFERTGSLNKPSSVLSANMQRLQAQHARIGTQVPQLIEEMLQTYPAMAEKYRHPGSHNDRLFEATYAHQNGATCKQCDPQKVVKRHNRRSDIPVIHYGTIGSGNTVVKDAAVRDQLRKDLGILCIEMEAAGLMDEFRCLVIRGICEYADSHKNKRWQPYAAATAAAYAKELLSIIPLREVATTSKVASELPFSGSDGLDAWNRYTNPVTTISNNHGEVENQAGVQNITGRILFH